MSLARARQGDIVQVAGSLWRVLDKEPRRLRVASVGSTSIRWAKASEVETIWRRV